MTLSAPTFFALLLLAAAPLAGCAQPGGGTATPAASATAASGASAPSEPTRLSAVYDCGRDRIAARFGGGGVTIGLPDGRSMTLPQAAGGGYGDGSITFRESGGLASVTTPTGSWTDCKPLS